MSSRRVETDPGLEQALRLEKRVQAFEIESQADQAPLTSGSQQTPQRKLAEADDFFDDADEGFHGAFSQAVNGLSSFGLQLVGHFLSGAGFFSGCLWQLSE
jgi:hypothetical protein